MKAFLKHSSLFFLAFIPFYILMCIVWGEIIPPAMSGNLKYKRGGHGHTLARTHEAKSIAHPDMLFLGSSHCFRGFDPRIFAEAGYRIFNFGSNTQTPRQTEVLMLQYLDKIQPRLVVLEIYPELFEQDGEECMLDLLSNDTIDSPIIQHSFDLGDFRVLHTLGFAWYKQNLARNAPQDQPYEGYGDRYIRGGFNQKLDQQYSGKEDLFKSEWKPLDAQKAAFERIISKCKSLDIPVVMVQGPVIRTMYNCRVDNPKIDSYFASHGTYYNFNEAMDFSSREWFFDAHHLNQSGVNRFNQAFIEKMKADQLLNN
ncbi:MAG: hypothetical protein ACOYLH_03315 [Flavobacteriales bacterium]